MSILHSVVIGRWLLFIVVMQTSVATCADENCYVKYNDDRVIQEGDCEGSTDHILSELKSKVAERGSQSCKEKIGFILGGKCYFAPHVSTSSFLNHNQAIQKCISRNSMIAELNSPAQQDAIHAFFVSVIPPSWIEIQLWIGMTYQSSEGILQFRSGKRVSENQFKWYINYPSGSDDKILIHIRKDRIASFEGIINRKGSANTQGVICEKPL